MEKIMRSKLCVLLALVVLLTTGCGSLYESKKDGYTTVTSVNGVTFDMPSTFLSKATAITSISEDIDYSSGTYLYKNGKDMYIMFNINEVIIAVQNGTSYDMKNAKEKADNMENSSVCDVWLTKNKKFSYDEQTKNGVYKLIGTTNADISITATVYGELTGMFATVQYEDYECSVFAGVPVKEDGMTSKEKEILEHIVKSLTVDRDYVDLFYNKSTETADTSVTEPVEKDTEAVEEIVPEESTEDVAEIIVEDTEEITTEDTEATEDAEDEESSETDSEIIVIEDTEVSTEEETVLEEPEENISGKEPSKYETNQSSAKNGYSDIYHMLSVGDSGFLNALDNNGKDLVETSVTLNAIYKDQEAIDIIKEYCKTDECLYEYENAPAGYSWQVAEYTLKDSPEKLYVNSKILGLDGSKLKFRGIAAPSRTYDMHSFIKKSDTGYEKVYCYYAVPNGCKEYMLEFGNRFTETGGTACYKIKN